MEGPLVSRCGLGKDGKSLSLFAVAGSGMGTEGKSLS